MLFRQVQKIIRDKVFKLANEALNPSPKDLARRRLISFTKHKRPISSEDLEVLYAANQLGLNPPESFPNSAWFNTILYFGKRDRENHIHVKTNARYPVFFSSTTTTTTSRLKYFISSEKATKISAPDFTHSVFHGCKFWDWNTLLSSPVCEQSVGIYEPKAPSFRVFDPRGVTRINFRWQLVKFGPITVDSKVVLLPHVNHAHSPSDHHWLFYHFYERF